METDEMRISLIIAVVLLTASRGQFFRTNPLPTHQIPDILVVGDDSLSIYSNPLEQAFGDNNPRPDEIFKEGCTSTACWRGYQAVWRLEEDFLYLVAVRDCCDENTLSDDELNALVGGRYREGRAFAVWFSGEILAPQGKLLRYVHMGYVSIYEREVIFRFKQGRLVAQDTVSNVPTRDPVFPGGIEAFQRYIAKKVDWGQLPEQARHAIAIVVVDTQGVASVDTVYRAANPQIAKEIARVVSSAPAWEPGYERGQKTEYRWGITINYRASQEK
jgi:hypothetical protein